MQQQVSHVVAKGIVAEGLSGPSELLAGHSIIALVCTSLHTASQYLMVARST